MRKIQPGAIHAPTLPDASSLDSVFNDFAHAKLALTLPSTTSTFRPPFTPP